MNLKNENIKIILGVILIVILSASMIIAHQKDLKKEISKEETKTTQKEEVKQFRKSELILWELFLREAKAQKYIIEENLESIELIEIVDYGKYLKNLPNIRYEQINFAYKCKSGTICVTDTFPKLKEDSDIREATTIIDLTDKEYIEMTGFSFRMDAELVPIEGPFVYVGETD